MSVGIPCPRCRNPLEPHARMCPACGGPALVERAEGEDTPACATHRERVASAACARCGVFGCATCLVVVGDEVWCRKCRPPAPGLAWEDPTRALFVRFVATAWAFLTRPMASAREVKNGSVGWAWVFAALCLAPQVAAWAMVGELAKTPEQLLTIAASTGLLMLGWLLVLPLGEFLALRAMGLEVSFTTQLRATAYSSAGFVVPWCGCVGLALWGPLVRLATLRSAFDLTWGQALIAVSALPLTCVCAVVATRADLPFWA
ncbi:MAG: hypothetical protein Q8L48_07820 [Archangium sp.]|nr:hypothetical protein [Archangium sp.]